MMKPKLFKYANKFSQIGKGGFLYGEDWNYIVKSLSLLDDLPYYNFVEIGCAQGKTSKSIIQTLRIIGKSFSYYGIDPGGYHPLPNLQENEFTFINKRSFEALDDLPEKIHWLMIDGCHCYNCCKEDLELYLPKVASGGLILFHDASKNTMGLDPQIYDSLSDHHDIEVAKKGIQVRKVLDEINEKSIRLIVPAKPQNRGGLEIYRKG